MFVEHFFQHFIFEQSFLIFQSECIIYHTNEINAYKKHLITAMWVTSVDKQHNANINHDTKVQRQSFDKNSTS